MCAAPASPVGEVVEGISDVNVLASDVLEVVFSTNVLNTIALSAADAWRIDAVETGALVTVRSVLSTQQVAIDRVKLVVTQPSSGEPYNVVALGIVDRTAVAQTGETLTGPDTKRFTGRETKLDRVLSRATKIYDKTPTAVYRNVLGAIAVEDDRIGGMQNELLSEAVSTVVEVLPTGFESWFTARLSANQTTSVNVNNHLELDVSYGTAATLSTGSGQAQGLITVAEDGDYYIGFGGRAEVNEGLFVLQLQDHPGNVGRDDNAGNNLRIIGHDNQGTDSSECSWSSSVFTLAANDVLKVAIQSETQLVQIENLFGSFLMLKL